MEVKLTELEKSILLAVLSVTKGKQYVRRDELVFKFPKRQRRMVEKFIDRLTKEKLLTQHPTEKSYKLSELGLKRALRLLAEGAMLWRVG